MEPPIKPSIRPEAPASLISAPPNPFLHNIVMARVGTKAIMPPPSIDHKLSPLALVMQRSKIITQRQSSASLFVKSSTEAYKRIRAKATPLRIQATEVPTRHSAVETASTARTFKRLFTLYPFSFSFRLRYTVARTADKTIRERRMNSPSEIILPPCRDYAV